MADAVRIIDVGTGQRRAAEAEYGEQMAGVDDDNDGFRGSSAAE
ncbi:hypothetical protein SNOG_05926 [Parastagonospora nodorum SN15]|uniref:Uncharacterized protein n=1 Tax=Phaeosphaeria nodorum (strain SN15 / ATCC MYA-4574 / FGSC 10173) TaxID=321614 RepID=Q0UQN8_PHANO|nr:hypothetical protein SNOG_05926 [Parastagonospora nodorum SN15]EAT86990.1 hypothetical protein SNOG_05926 [Parastagonospora nodorum SN15]